MGEWTLVPAVSNGWPFHKLPLSLCYYCYSVAPARAVVAVLPARLLDTGNQARQSEMSELDLTVRQDVSRTDYPAYDRIAYDTSSNRNKM